MLLSLTDSFCYLIQIKVLLCCTLGTAWVSLFFQIPIFGTLTENQTPTRLSPKCKLAAPGLFSSHLDLQSKPTVFCFLVGVSIWGPRKEKLEAILLMGQSDLETPQPSRFPLEEHLGLVLNMLSIHDWQFVTIALFGLIALCFIFRK